MRRKKIYDCLRMFFTASTNHNPEHRRVREKSSTVPENNGNLLDFFRLLENCENDGWKSAISLADARITAKISHTPHRFTALYECLCWFLLKNFFTNALFIYFGTKKRRNTDPDPENDNKKLLIFPYLWFFLP